MTNRFIHHPVIQNDRQRGGDSAVVEGRVAGTGTAGGTAVGVAATNVHDKEQFPSLSTAALSSSVAPPVTKLNFKEMVLKNAAAAGAGAGVGETCSSSTSIGAGVVAVVRDVPKVRTEYSRTPLSSGNIFLGAFYGSRNDGGDDGGDEDVDGDGGGDMGGGGSGSGGFISSTLIDSCDRKYDNLYR
jgi:hypothetical protein